MAQWAAGETITGAKLSTLAGAESVRTANTASFTTTETVVDTITVPGVNGRRYKIVWDGGFFSTVADGYVRARIREDTVIGTQLQLKQMSTVTVANQTFPLEMVAFWTATSTGNKTFVATCVRQAGTGSITAQASSDAPTNFYVENISGA